MTDGEKKLTMVNVISDALLKSKMGMGDKFQNALKSTLESRRKELESALNTQMEGILIELSKLKVLSESINKIDELLESFVEE